MIAQKAKELGYNVIRCPSERAQGVNIAIFSDFQILLIPQMVVPIAKETAIQFKANTLQNGCNMKFELFTYDCKNCKKSYKGPVPIGTYGEFVMWTNTGSNAYLEAILSVDQALLKEISKNVS